MPDFWEQSWQRDRDRDFFAYARPYYRLASPEIELFRQHAVRTVCDAGCGWGAYSLALASNGFAVTAFDLSETAVEIAGRVLARYGLGLAGCKTASVLDTGWPDGTFDAVVCFSVLDHMTVSDAKRALRELGRITRPGGLLLLAFDAPDGDDLATEHDVLPDGSVRYASGMVFHPYDVASAENLLAGLRIVHRGHRPQRGEYFYYRDAVKNMPPSDEGDGSADRPSRRERI